MYFNRKEIQKTKMKASLHFPTCVLFLAHPLHAEVLSHGFEGETRQQMRFQAGPFPRACPAYMTCREQASCGEL